MLAVACIINRRYSESHVRVGLSCIMINGSPGQSYGPFNPNLCVTNPSLSFLVPETHNTSRNQSSSFHLHVPCPQLSNPLVEPVRPLKLSRGQARPSYGCNCVQLQIYHDYHTRFGFLKRRYASSAGQPRVLKAAGIQAGPGEETGLASEMPFCST